MTELGTLVGFSEKSGNVTTLSPSWTDVGTIQAGDTALLFWGYNQTLTPASTPAGLAKPFAQHVNSPQDDSTERLTLWTRACDGTESGSLGSFGFGGGTRHVAILIVIRGGAAGAVVMTKAADANTDATHPLPALTPDNADVFVLGVAAERSSTTSTSTSSVPAGYTVASDFGSSGTGGQWMTVVYEGSAGTFTSNHVGGVAINPGNIVFDTANSDVAMMTVAIRPKGKTLAPATETDTAQALARRKSRTAAPSTETDTSTALARLKARTVTPATETDTAPVLGRRKSRAVTPPLETDTSPLLARLKRRTLAPAGSTDSAPPLGRLKSLALAVAVEAGAAVALARTKLRSLTPSTETGTAVPLAGGLVAPGVIARTLTPATETDTAVPLRALKSRTIAAVTETDSVPAMARTKSRLLTAATESALVVALARLKRRTVTPAAETDLATLLGRLKSWWLTPAAETDAPVPLAHGAIGAPVPSPGLSLTTARSSSEITNSTGTLAVQGQGSHLELVAARSNLDLMG